MIECKGCYYFSEKLIAPEIKKPFCWRVKELVTDFSRCGTGRLFAEPNTGPELMNIVAIVEEKWRKEGEKNV